jgi:hypothetical protein
MYFDDNPRTRKKEVWEPESGCNIIGPMFFGSSGNPAASIYNALVAWWDFEQNDSGTQFFDSVGNNHLNIINSSGPLASSSASNTGKVGRGLAAGSSDSSSIKAFIPRSNTALDLTNTDWTFGGWMQRGGTSSYAVTLFVLGRIGSGAGSITVCGLNLNAATSNLVCAWVDSTSTAYSIDTGSPQSGGWLMYAATLNRAANQVEFRWRLQSGGSMSKSVLPFPNPLYTAANTANFCFNNALRGDSSTFVDYPRSGLNTADSSYFMSKAITDDEFLYLFNSGAGKNFAQLTADAATSSQLWGASWGTSWGA